MLASCPAKLPFPRTPLSSFVKSAPLLPKLNLKFCNMLEQRGRNVGWQGCVLPDAAAGAGAQLQDASVIRRVHGLVHRTSLLLVPISLRRALCQWLSCERVQHDEAREESEKEVIAATRIMINERVPALAAELNTLDTSSFREIYSRNGVCSPLTHPHHTRHTRVPF